MTFTALLIIRLEESPTTGQCLSYGDYNFQLFLCKIIRTKPSGWGLNKEIGICQNAIEFFYKKYWELRSNNTRNIYLAKVAFYLNRNYILIWLLNY